MYVYGDVLPFNILFQLVFSFLMGVISHSRKIHILHISPFFNFLPKLIELSEALRRYSIYFREISHDKLYGIGFTKNFIRLIRQLCVSMRNLEGALVGRI